MAAAFEAEEARLAPEWERLRAGRKPQAVFRTASYVSRGRYADQLERWLSHTSPEQLLIVDFDDLVTRPMEVVDACWEFVGVDPVPLLASELSPHNVGSATRSEGEVPDWLRLQFLDDNDRLAGLLGDVSTMPGARFEWCIGS